MALYEMIDVEKVPEHKRGRKPSPHLDQIRYFLRTGKRCVRLSIEDETLELAYKGLYQASHNPQIKGRVNVIKARDGIYLERVR